MDVVRSALALWRPALPAAVAVAGAGGVTRLRPIWPVVVGRQEHPLRLEALDRLGRDPKPVGGRLERARRQVDLAIAERLVRVALHFAEGGCLGRHLGAA